MIRKMLTCATFTGALLGASQLWAAAQTVPPASFQGQWWTHPAGCEYSRAGRPGETVWFLIVNSRKSGCPTFIATQTSGSVYTSSPDRD